MSIRLHIVPDEKIINRTIDLFEQVYPGQNQFVVFTTGRENTCKYLEKRNKIVFFIKFGSKSFWSLIDNIDIYDSVIIHYLSILSAKFLKRISHNNIYWIEWGGDLYNTFLEFKGFKLYYNERLIKYVKYSYFPFFIYSISRYFYRKRTMRILKTAVKKIKFFIPDSMYDEYPLFLKYYPEFSFLKYKEFYYYPIDLILGDELIESNAMGNSIMIGNSCSFTGNHLYVLEKLKNLGVQNNIIIPLSYSGNSKYQNIIINYGYSVFGNKFKPVTKFLPIQEYNKLLLSANIFIYGSFRQEAVGNILIALYIGGKVFLDSRNPLLVFYKSLGLTLFSIDELSHNNLNSPLSEEIIIKNRKILLENYSSSRLVSLIQKNFQD